MKEKSVKMNDIFQWIIDHPDVELMMTMHRDSFIVQLTHVDSRYRLKHAFYVEQMEPYILDVLYDELKRRIGQSVFMEESDG